MGAAGDMLTAALIELLPDPEGFTDKMNALGIPGICIKKEKSIKCGITGTHISVTVNGVEEESYDYNYHQKAKNTHNQKHTHGDLHNIENIIRNLQLPEKVKDDIIAVYELIAEAESHVHGVPIKEIHFHEVGTMDAIADITAVCLLMDMISPDEVILSPVHVGSGQVKCAHGILPVPAPATAYILKDVPIYGGSIKGELCTPTGAALLKYFATSFGNMPIMKIQAIGYGMGKKDFEAANCVRALIGETEGKRDVVVELSCNVDDMTAEGISFAMDRFFEGGALEVYTIPIGMKKSRPGTLIRVMCTEERKSDLVALIFKHTTTIGIRETQTHRYVLDRKILSLETPFGIVHQKQSTGYGVSRTKYEYDDISKIAKENGMSLDELIQAINKYNNGDISL